LFGQSWQANQTQINQSRIQGFVQSSVQQPRIKEKLPAMSTGDKVLNGSFGSTGIE
jgi:hypothetical protein